VFCGGNGVRTSARPQPLDGGAGVRVPEAVAEPAPRWYYPGDGRGGCPLGSRAEPSAHQPHCQTSLCFIPSFRTFNQTVTLVFAQNPFDLLSSLPLCLLSPTEPVLNLFPSSVHSPFSISCPHAPRMATVALPMAFGRSSCAPAVGHPVRNYRKGAASRGRVLDPNILCVVSAPSPSGDRQRAFPSETTTTSTAFFWAPNPPLTRPPLPPEPVGIPAAAAAGGRWVRL